MSCLRCIIIDDEPLPLELLSDYIGKVPYLQLAGTYNSPLDALALIQQGGIDLVFLDIQMPELNGVQFMEIIQGKSKAIFTTAYMNYAFKGYELDIVDYLLKPISFERFLKAVGKLKPALPAEPETFTGDKQTSLMSMTENVLFVKEGHKIIKIFLSEILYIEGLKEYIVIHLSDKKIIILQSMKKMENALPPTHFFRTHKSFIVALEKIDSIEKNRILIKNKVIPIGDTYKDAFFTALNNKTIL